MSVRHGGRVGQWYRAGDDGFTTCDGVVVEEGRRRQVMKQEYYYLKSELSVGTELVRESAARVGRVRYETDCLDEEEDQMDGNGMGGTERIIYKKTWRRLASKKGVVAAERAWSAAVIPGLGGVDFARPGTAGLAWAIRTRRRRCGRAMTMGNHVD